MSNRRAVLIWRSGQRAILSAKGWRVEPPDELLAELLNTNYSLAAMQARRETLIPDLLGCAAKAAALATGAELAKYDPPVRVKAARS